jgi:hypothetical protein
MFIARLPYIKLLIVVLAGPTDYKSMADAPSNFIYLGITFLIKVS